VYEDSEEGTARTQRPGWLSRTRIIQKYPRLRSCVSARAVQSFEHGFFGTNAGHLREAAKTVCCRLSSTRAGTASAATSRLRFCSAAKSIAHARASTRVESRWEEETARLDLAGRRYSFPRGASAWHIGAHCSARVVWVSARGARSGQLQGAGCISGRVRRPNTASTASATPVAAAAAATTHAHRSAATATATSTPATAAVA
jgi:hypothetical protein